MTPSRSWVIGRNKLRSGQSTTNMDEFENLRSEFEALTEEKKDLQGQLAIANAESYVSSKSKLERFFCVLSF